MKNPYEILGVPPDATIAEITRAYRRLLRQHDPDTAPGRTDLDAHRLRQIFAAYQQLRRTYSTRQHHPTGTDIPIRRRTSRPTAASWATAS